MHDALFLLGQIEYAAGQGFAPIQKGYSRDIKQPFGSATGKPFLQ